MRLAIFGSPVAHSLSPVMHRAALNHIGADGEYEARDVDQSGLYGGIAEIRRGVLAGANITMPYKALAYELCDELTSQAETVGAVNTLLMEDGSLVGENTDVDGIASAWALRRLSQSEPVIILGAGGASSAAQLALRGREQYVVARRPPIAQAIVDRIGTGATVVEWGEQIPSGVVVNATSLGMRGEMLPEVLLHSAVGLFDMPYGDVPTRAVQFARDRGIPVADGLDMLVGQAVGSFAAWTGVDVEPVVFRTAAEAELARRAV